MASIFIKPTAVLISFQAGTKSAGLRVGEWGTVGHGSEQRWIERYRIDGGGQKDIAASRRVGVNRGQ